MKCQKKEQHHLISPESSLDEDVSNERLIYKQKMKAKLKIQLIISRTTHLEVIEALTIDPKQHNIR